MIDINKIYSSMIENNQLDEGINDTAIFKAVFLAGGPGSGKSFIGTEKKGKSPTVGADPKQFMGGGQLGLINLGLRVVNPDPAYEKLLKAAGLDPKSSDDIWSDEGQDIRVKASALTAKQKAHYVNERLGIIIDGTGKDVNKIIGQKKLLDDAGYETAMIYVNTNLETAIARDAKRDRTLGAKAVTKMWDAVQKNVKKYKSIFGSSMYIIDNSDGSNWLEASQKAHKKIEKWVRKSPSSPKAKAWIASQDKMRNAPKSGIREEDSHYLPGYTAGFYGYDPETSRSKIQDLHHDIRRCSSINDACNEVSEKWHTKLAELSKLNATHLDDLDDEDIEKLLPIAIEMRKEQMSLEEGFLDTFLGRNMKKGNVAKKRVKKSKNAEQVKLSTEIDRKLRLIDDLMQKVRPLGGNLGRLMSFRKLPIDKMTPKGMYIALNDWWSSIEDDLDDDSEDDNEKYAQSAEKLYDLWEEVGFKLSDYMWASGYNVKGIGQMAKIGFPAKKRTDPEWLKMNESNELDEMKEGDRPVWLSVWVDNRILPGGVHDSKEAGMKFMVYGDGPDGHHLVKTTRKVLGKKRAGMFVPRSVGKHLDKQPFPYDDGPQYSVHKESVEIDESVYDKKLAQAWKKVKSVPNVRGISNSGQNHAKKLSSLLKGSPDKLTFEKLELALGTYETHAYKAAEDKKNPHGKEDLPKLQEFCDSVDEVIGAMKNLHQSQLSEGFLDTFLGRNMKKGNVARQNPIRTLGKLGKKNKSIVRKLIEETRRFEEAINGELFGTRLQRQETSKFMKSIRNDSTTMSELAKDFENALHSWNAALDNSIENELLDPMDEDYWQDKIYLVKDLVKKILSEMWKIDESNELPEGFMDKMKQLVPGARNPQKPQEGKKTAMQMQFPYARLSVHRMIVALRKARGTAMKGKAQGKDRRENERSLGVILAHVEEIARTRHTEQPNSGRQIHDDRNIDDQTQQYFMDKIRQNDWTKADQEILDAMVGNGTDDYTKGGAYFKNLAHDIALSVKYAKKDAGIKESVELDEKGPKVDMKKYAAHMDRNKKKKTMSSTKKNLSSIAKRAEKKANEAKDKFLNIETQLDELSPKTKKSYKDKATRSIGNEKKYSDSYSDASKSDPDNPTYKSRADQHKRKLKNRMAGVKQADESTLGELSMTKSDLTKTGMRVDSKKMAELKKELMRLKKGLKVKMEEYIVESAYFEDETMEMVARDLMIMQNKILDLVEIMDDDGMGGVDSQPISLEPWVVAKITKAKDYLDSIHDYTVMDNENE